MEKKGGVQITKNQQYVFIGLIVLIIAVVGAFMLTGSSDEPGTQISEEGSSLASEVSGSNGTEESASKASEELVAAVGTHGGEPEAGFDPIAGWGDNHEPLVQSTLFKKDSNGNLINDLATNYTISNYGLTWTVK